MYYKKKTFIQKIVFSPVFAALLVFFLVYLVIGLISLIQKSVDASRAREQAEAEVTELQARKDIIEGKLARIETRAGEEEIIREQFPVVKEGERVVVIVPQEEVASPEVEERRGFWQFLFGWMR